MILGFSYINSQFVKNEIYAELIECIRSIRC